MRSLLAAAARMWLTERMHRIRAQGFGFVTFVHAEEAERAKNVLHGTFIDGRRIEVRCAALLRLASRSLRLSPLTLMPPARSHRSHFASAGEQRHGAHRQQRAYEAQTTRRGLW